jgi:hypothetical protein
VWFRKIVYSLKVRHFISVLSFEVFTRRNPQIAAVKIVTPCSPSAGYRRFGGTMLRLLRVLKDGGYMPHQNASNCLSVSQPKTPQSVAVICVGNLRNVGLFEPLVTKMEQPIWEIRHG